MNIALIELIQPLNTAPGASRKTNRIIPAA